MRELGPTELKRLHRDWRRRTEGRLSLVLDGVQGPFNVGAIIRTAAAYRLDTLWVTATATGPDNPKVGKTALENVLRELESQASDSPPVPIKSAGRVGSRVGKVSELSSTIC